MGQRTGFNTRRWWCEARDGQRVEAIAKELGCSALTVRRRLHRFDAEGIVGLGDHSKPGRPRHLTTQDDSTIIALAHMTPPGRLATVDDGVMVARDEQAEAQWSLDALARGRDSHLHRRDFRPVVPRLGCLTQWKAATSRFWQTLRPTIRPVTSFSSRII